MPKKYYSGIKPFLEIPTHQSNIPTHAVCSSFGTSSPTAHMEHLSSKSWIVPGGQVHSNGFAEVGTLSPGQLPESFKSKLLTMNVEELLKIINRYWTIAV